MSTSNTPSLVHLERKEYSYYLALWWLFLSTLGEKRGKHSLTWVTNESISLFFLTFLYHLTFLITHSQITSDIVVRNFLNSLLPSPLEEVKCFLVGPCQCPYCFIHLAILISHLSIFFSKKAAICPFIGSWATSETSSTDQIIWTI